MFFFFFFSSRRRHTRFSRDWSSDVCSSDLYVIYENAGRSYLISRQDDGAVRAFHNVCLHRGRKLRTQDGTADRSEERRVGKECRFRWSTDHKKEKKYI